MNAISPVAQDFIWCAEYDGNEFFTEFDMETQEEHSFYDIQKERLVRFGLCGRGMRFYYEVFGGVWKLAGQMVELVYQMSDKEIHLTGRAEHYNDIITYKDASNDINLTTGQTGPMVITQFNAGYKTTFTEDGVDFHLKTLCMVPYGLPIHLNIRLVASARLNGKLVLKRNGVAILEIPAPLAPNVAGEVNWVVS